jgi:hypothetical protein
MNANTTASQGVMPEVGSSAVETGTGLYFLHHLRSTADFGLGMHTKEAAFMQHGYRRPHGPTARAQRAESAHCGSAGR